MKIPLSWLKDLFAFDMSSEKLSEVLTEIGIEVENIESVEEECVLHAALTPNLIHAASMLGIARELAALSKTTFQFPDCAIKKEGEKAATDFITVSVENSEMAPRYSGRVIYDVKVAPSPKWLQKRLELMGLRCVNNVVDVTNYVLFEMGHPLHAFDLDKLEKKSIVVRNAKKGEKITTLDGKEHFPTEETLVIADGVKPQALAGIMGGIDSEVNDATTTVFLESAYFEPGGIRRAGKRMNVHTEASHRFERGADPNSVLLALDRAAELIATLSGGTVAKGVIEKTAKSFEPKQIDIRLKRVNTILGTHFVLSELESILKQSGGVIVSSSADSFRVAVPTFRIDLNAEIDLIEEVARLYGYNNIHDKKHKSMYTGSALPHSPLYLFDQKMRKACLQEGLQELLTCNLISPQEAQLIDIASIKPRFLIKLLNPSSVDQSVLRPSLLPGMLRVVKYNLAHETNSVAGFEIGKVHFKLKEGYYEPLVGAIVLSGKSAPHTWSEKTKECDFYTLKGMLENIFRNLNVFNVRFLPSKYPNFHPGRQARMMIEECEIGILGQVHPATLAAADVASDVFFAELNLEDLMPYVVKDLKMKPLPLYPGSTRDWTLSLKQNCLQECLCDEVFEAIAAARSPILENVSLLDVYQSLALGSKSKKLTFRFCYRRANSTIELKEVEEEHKRMTQSVSAKLRDKVLED